MPVFHSATRTVKALYSYLLAGIDWLRYCVAEFRNVDRHHGWEPGEMTELLSGQQGTRDEIHLARVRREFWTRLADDGTISSNLGGKL